jgi:hypothetical protein
MTYNDLCEQDLWPLIQKDILGALQADQFIGTRSGVAIEPGDIQSVIDMKLAQVIGAGLDGKSGVGFLVLPIERAEDENPNIPGGPLKLTITIDFTENVIINQSNIGTGRPIRIYARRALKILKLYTPVGLTQSLVAATPAISEFTDDKRKNIRNGRVEFTATEADFFPFNRLQRPQIVVAGSVLSPAANAYQLLGGNVTATVNAPGGSTIYFTTDGTHPWEGNPDAQIYDGPVPIAGPGLFRARAFPADNSNAIASDTAAASFFN